MGLPPGRFRQTEGTDGIYTPVLNLQQEGGGKMLNYNLDCSPLESYLRVQQLLPDDVKELVAKITTETTNVRTVDPHIYLIFEQRYYILLVMLFSSHLTHPLYLGRLFLQRCHR